MYRVEKRPTDGRRERRAITADTALRLSRFFGTTPEFWMNLQSCYDLRKAANENGDRREIREASVQTEQSIRTHCSQARGS